MVRREIDRQARLRKKAESSPELLKASRQMALLAIIHQDRPLNPRETEELRRALTAAGNVLSWSDTTAHHEDPAADFALDMASLATIGVDSLSSDLAEERTKKQTETSRLNEAVAYARKLAANTRAKYPVDITYTYTARDPQGTLITKTATNTVTNEEEALGAAESLEKSIESRTKLTDQMVIDLDERRKRLQAIARDIPEFVKSSRHVLDAVIASI